MIRWRLIPGFWILCGFLSPDQPGEQRRISVSGNMFTYLIFADTVNLIDVGSGELFADYQENIVKLTPASSQLDETSLFVRLNNRNFYYFLVSYDDSTRRYVHRIESQREENAASQALANAPRTSQPLSTPEKEGESAGEFDSLLLADIEKRIIYDRSSLPAASKESIALSLARLASQDAGVQGVATYENQLQVQLETVAFDGQFLYLQLLLLNRASLTFPLGFSKFFIRTRGGLKKKAMQEWEELPVAHHLSASSASKNEEIRMVYVFEKFSMNKDKTLAIELWESEGDRKCSLTVGSRFIMNPSILR